MVGWHHQLNEHEFEQTPGDNEGEGSLVCCSLRGHKEPDMTKGLNSNIKHKGPAFKTCTQYAGGPVAKTLCSQCRGPGFHPWSGN